MASIESDEGSGTTATVATPPDVDCVLPGIAAEPVHWL
jgi:hypothetical protein